MPQDNRPDMQLVVFQATEGEVQFLINGDKDTLWGTRQQIAGAFGCTEDNVRKHIRNIYEEKELDESATSEKNSEVQTEGGRHVRRQFERYNLDVILAVGYRVSTQKATRFRQWATKTLKQFLTSGFVLDEVRLSQDMDAQRELAKKLRAIRLEERSMYGKVRDVFKTSAAEYDAQSQAAKTFFAMAQDKFHYAITGKIAAEIVLGRADGRKQNMGLRTMKGDDPTFDDAKIAKNYLQDRELEGLENICEQFMLFTESKAFRGHRMTMEEIATKLNILLAANDYPVLYEYKTYMRAQADAHAKKQLEVYRHRIEAPKEKPSLPAPKKKR